MPAVDEVVDVDGLAAAGLADEQQRLFVLHDEGEEEVVLGLVNVGHHQVAGQDVPGWG